MSALYIVAQLRALAEGSLQLQRAINRLTCPLGGCLPVLQHLSLSQHIRAYPSEAATQETSKTSMAFSSLSSWCRSRDGCQWELDPILSCQPGLMVDMS